MDVCRKKTPLQSLWQCCLQHLQQEQCHCGSPRQSRARQSLRSMLLGTGLLSQVRISFNLDLTLLQLGGSIRQHQKFFGEEESSGRKIEVPETW